MGGGSGVPVTDIKHFERVSEHGNFRKVGMVSYWTFFHENLYGSSLQVFLTTDEVGRIYVDFSSYNSETHISMILKFLHIDHIWSKIESKVSILVVL